MLVPNLEASGAAGTELNRKPSRERAASLIRDRADDGV